MPLPSLCGERDVREGIKVPGSILEFHFPLPLPIPSCCFSSERGKRGEREKGGEHAPEFPEHPSNREAAAQAGGAQPSTRSAPRCPLPLPRPLCPLQVRASPLGQPPPLRPCLPSAWARHSPLLSFPAMPPSPFQPPLPSLPEAQRLRPRRGTGAVSYRKTSSNTTGKGNGLCAHTCQRLDLLEGIWTLSPHRCLLD